MLKVESVEDLPQSVQKDMVSIVGNYNSVFNIERKLIQTRTTESYMVLKGNSGESAIYKRNYFLGFEQLGELVATITEVK